MKYPENAKLGTSHVIIKAEYYSSMEKIAEYFGDNIDDLDVTREGMLYVADEFEYDGDPGAALDIASDIAKLGITVYSFEIYYYFDEEGMLPVITIKVE